MVGMAKRANNNPISGTEIVVPRLVVQGVYSRIFFSESGQRMHLSCVEDGLVLAVIGRCALLDRLQVGGGRIQTG